MSNDSGHRALEGKATLFAILCTVAIGIGTVVEVVPLLSLGSQNAEEMGIQPYTPLEVAGRDIYVREGCYVCHSQMIRPMRAETLRYGDWTRSVEYAYDRPFQLGSRRIGPDLQREGGRRSDDWHYEHMDNPRSTSPGSVMPAYPWLLRWEVDPADTRRSVMALKRLGHPYPDGVDVAAAMRAQGDIVVDNLADKGIETTWNKEIVAVIAYLQRLGTDGAAMLDASASTGGAP